MTAPAIPSHPCADNPAYAICSPCCNVPRRCRQTLPRPAPASGPWCRVCPQGARTHLPGRAVWPISGDGSCRTCHAVYGMSMYDTTGAVPVALVAGKAFFLQILPPF